MSGRSRAVRRDRALRLYSWNVNGLRAVLRKGAFHSFARAHAPDILCLQETRAGSAQIRVDLPGYHQCWNPAARPGYSGTAIFSRERPLSLAHGFPRRVSRRFRLADELARDAATEGRVITAEFRDFWVVTVYTPNTKDDLSRLALRCQHWDPAFLLHVQALQKVKPVIFCGDLNVAHTEQDLAHPAANRGRKGFTPEERRGFQNFIDAGFLDTFRLFREGNGHYSWWSNLTRARERNVGWRIDYILVSDALRGRVIAADIHPKVMGSDHCPVSLTLER
jgi:exodeoxyribonuclease III